MPDATTSVEPATLSQALLGKELLSSPWARRFLAWPIELRTTLVATLLAGVVFLPYLGAVGLWDPWETHYGEVAREMIQRNDYVHPYWENAYFFSKYPFTMWLMVLGMRAAESGTAVAVVLGVLLAGLGALLLTRRVGKGWGATGEFLGVLAAALGVFFLGLFAWGASVQLSSPWKLVNDVAAGDGALPLFTEWGFRLPSALFSVLAVSLLTYALTVTVNARAALATAVVLVTMPLYFLITRQAVTDTPVMSGTIAGIACAMVGMFHRTTRYRSEWWYAAYVFFAVATLAKGLLGFGVPMVVYVLYVVIAELSFSAESLKAHVAWARKHLATPVLYGAVAGVAVGLIAAWYGRQYNITFWAVPIINNRSYIEPHVWLGIMWGSLVLWIVATVMLHRARAAVSASGEPPTLFRLAYRMRLGTGILLFLAVCLPWYYRMFTFWRVDDESKQFWFRFVYDHFARLVSGVHTTTPGGDFSYFILQGGYAMFPWVALIPGALATVARARPRGGTGFDGAALIAVLWFTFTWLLIGGSATKFHHYVLPMLPPMAIAMGLFIDRLWDEGIERNAMVLLFGLPLFFLVGKDLWTTPKDFTDLFVYNYDRPYPQKEVVERFNVSGLLRAGTLAVLAVSVVFAAVRSRVGLFTSALAASVGFALWFNWVHWVDLSHHWTQRDQFWRYYTGRKPGEPIASFLMNWRGETFYSRNTVKQIKDGNYNLGLSNYANQPGREWALVEHARLNILKAAVGPDKNVTLVDRDLNNKFVLVTIE